MSNERIDLGSLFEDDIVLAHRGKLEAILADHRRYCAERISRSLPTHLLETHGDAIVRLGLSARDYAPDLFEVLPSTLIESQIHNIQYLFDVSQDPVAAVCFLEDVAESANPSQQLDETVSLVKLNHEHFGISYFQRYIATDVLAENVKNLDPKYKEKLPVCLLIQNTYDPVVVEEAFATDNYQKNIHDVLSANFKLFAVEVSETPEALHWITTTSTKYGSIVGLVLGGHGTAYSLKWSQPTEQTGSAEQAYLTHPKHYLSVNNKTSLSAVSECIDPNGAVILVSCSTGAGKEQEANLANSVSEALPRRKVYAPTTDAHTAILKFKYHNNELSADFGSRIGVLNTYQAQASCK